MRRWPWITTGLAAVFGFSPIGQSIFYNAFVSGEQLSRNIAEIFAYSAIGIAAVLAIIEVLIKRRLRRRTTET